MAPVCVTTVFVVRPHAMALAIAVMAPTPGSRAVSVHRLPQDALGGIAPTRVHLAAVEMGHAMVRVRVRGTTHQRSVDRLSAAAGMSMLPPYAMAQAPVELR